MKVIHLLQFQVKTSKKNTGSFSIILPVIFLISCGNNSEKDSHCGFRGRLKNTAVFYKPAVLKQTQAIPENSAVLKTPSAKYMGKIFSALCLLKSADSEHVFSDPVKIIKNITFLRTLFTFSNLERPVSLFSLSNLDITGCI